ncbi:MarR family winged helix-turn-helix transcriptional regulator [Leeia aquatica]|nr:helix-turn-helix domain-containing protein [Leeia aquatica]
MKTAQDMDAISQLTLMVFRLNGQLLAWGDELVAPLGLTSARWQTLGAMAMADQPLTAPQIAEVMGMTRQGAQKQLNVLLELGWVAAQANPAHKRSPQYGLTPQGNERYLGAKTLWEAEVSRLARAVPADEADQATATLHRLLQLLSLGTPA